MKKRAANKKLSDADWAVCQRLAEARETLGVTQAVFAEGIGIPKGTLATYEVGKAPIKLELGLRICRTWIISEEWLATGDYKIAREISLEKHKVRLVADLEKLNWVYFRQCMALGDHPIIGAIPPGMKFADAFSQYLAPIYKERIKLFYYFPRIQWRSTEWELGERLLSALIHRWILMMRSTAHLRGIKPDTYSAYFLRVMLRSGVLVSRKYLGFYGDFEKKLANELNAILEGQTPPHMSDQEVDAWAEQALGPQLSQPTVSAQKTNTRMATAPVTV